MSGDLFVVENLDELATHLNIHRTQIVEVECDDDHMDRKERKEDEIKNVVILPFRSARVVPYHSDNKRMGMVGMGKWMSTCVNESILDMFTGSDISQFPPLLANPLMERYITQDHFIDTNMKYLCANPSDRILDILLSTSYEYNLDLWAMCQNTNPRAMFYIRNTYEQSQVPPILNWNDLFSVACDANMTSIMNWVWQTVDESIRLNLPPHVNAFILCEETYGNDNILNFTRWAVLTNNDEMLKKYIQLVEDGDTSFSVRIASKPSDVAVDWLLKPESDAYRQKARHWLCTNPHPRVVHYLLNENDHNDMYTDYMLINPNPDLESFLKEKFLKSWDDVMRVLHLVTFNPNDEIFLHALEIISTHSHSTHPLSDETIELIYSRLSRIRNIIVDVVK